MSRLPQRSHEELITPLLTPISLLPADYQQLIHRENRRSWCRKHFHLAWARLTGQNTAKQLLKRKKMYMIAKMRMLNLEKELDTKPPSDFSNKID